jgi:uncharacterized protein
MKKLVLMIASCLALFSPLVCIAQQPDESAVPDRAQVMKFLELMHAKSQMVQALDQMAQQMRLGAEQGFKEKVPGATPEQLQKVDQMFDGIFKTLPIDEMVDAIVPIYQRHLTKSDLTNITAFYSSPTGQKVLKEMPAIMSEAMQVGGQIGRKAIAAKSDELDQKIAELVKETRKEKN